VDVGDELDEDADVPEPDEELEELEELEEEVDAVPVDALPLFDVPPVEEPDPVAAPAAAEWEDVPAGISFAASSPRATAAAAAVPATPRDTRRTRPVAALGRRATGWGVRGVMSCMEPPESRAPPRVS